MLQELLTHTVNAPQVCTVVSKEKSFALALPETKCVNAMLHTVLYL